MSLKKYKLEQSLSLSIHSVDKMMQCSAKKSRIQGCPCCEEIFIGREIKATTEIMPKMSAVFRDYPATSVDVYTVGPSLHTNSS
jgi:hypothetical protein